MGGGVVGDFGGLWVIPQLVCFVGDFGGFVGDFGGFAGDFGGFVGDFGGFVGDFGFVGGATKRRKFRPKSLFYVSGPEKTMTATDVTGFSAFFSARK